MLINNVFRRRYQANAMYMICTTLETWMVSNFKKQARISVNFVDNSNRAFIFDCI